MSVTLSPEYVSAVFGGILAALFAYFPVLNTSYAALSRELKSLIMIFALLLISIVVALLAKYGIIITSEPVTWATVLRVFISALIVNQPVHNILPETKAVIEIKDIRDSK